jgi:hypothetical protein
MTRRDRAALVLAYECLRSVDYDDPSGYLPWKRVYSAECSLRSGSDAFTGLIVALVEAQRADDAWIPDPASQCGRLLRARLALLIRAVLRADAGDYGRMVCTCFGEPRDVATHRDARYCEKPHPIRYTPLWQSAPATGHGAQTAESIARNGALRRAM